MIHAAALALLLAASDGGSDAPRIVSVRHAVAVSDDGRTFELDGGVWLDTELANQRSQDLARLSDENKTLRKEPVSVAPPLIVTLLIVVALGAGVAAGYLLPRP